VGPVRKVSPAAEQRHHAGQTGQAEAAKARPKEWFITGHSLVAHRVVGGVALVSGDPIGPPGEAASALDGFRAHARARGWAVAILGASERLLGFYRDRSSATCTAATSRSSTPPGSV
jgi:lysylphosphatidylglycerol synthetase-like protein (DUF2156 family)